MKRFWDGIGQCDCVLTMETLDSVGLRTTVSMWSNKSVLLAGGLVTIAIAIIVTLCIVLPNFNDANEVVENNEGIGDKENSLILIIENHGCLLTIWNVSDLNSTGTILKHNSTSNVDCYFDLFLNHSIYYNDNVKSIKSTSPSYPNMILPANFYSSLFEKPSHVPVVDFVNEKIYAISTRKSGEAPKLFVLDLWKSLYAILRTDLDEPTDLALDPTMGLLFISQRSSIARVSMDGSNMTKILENPRMASVLSIDRSVKRIYWSSQSNIESVDYAGGNRQMITSITSLPLSLTVMRGQIIWLTINLTGRKMLWTCRLNKTTGSCDSVRELQLNNNENMTKIKGYDSEEISSIMNSTSNPCATDNGGCEQFCLLSNSVRKGYSCACKSGQRLKEDKKSCVGPTDQAFLMYVQGAFARGKMLDHLGANDSEELRFGEAIYPVGLRLLPLDKYDTIYFAYDVRERLIYQVEKGIVVETSLIEYDRQPALIDIIPKSEALYLTTDWISKLIYVCTNMAKKASANEIRIYPYHYYANMESYKILVQLEKKYRLGSIVAHPNRGYVFFILAELGATSIQTRIVRTNSDGTGKHFFLENERLQRFGLAIDFLDDRLYWFSKDGTELKSIKVDGSMDSLRSINISMISYPMSMSFDKNFAYVGNWTHVWRLDKATGASAVHLKHVNPDMQDFLSGVSYHNLAAQPIIDNHPCVIDKGGCQTFCFAVPDEKTPKKLNKKCGCFEGENLQFDGKSCA